MKTILHSFVSSPASFFIPELRYYFCKSFLQEFLVTISQKHFPNREPFIADIESIPVKMRRIDGGIPVVSPKVFQIISFSGHGSDIEPGSI